MSPLTLPSFSSLADSIPLTLLAARLAESASRQDVAQLAKCEAVPALAEAMAAARTPPLRLPPGRDGEGVLRLRGSGGGGVAP